MKQLNKNTFGKNFWRRYWEKLCFLRNTLRKIPGVAIAGMGHLIPLVELAKWLVLHHNFFVTFIITTDDGSSMKPQKTVLKSLPDSISSVFLPPMNFDDLSKDVKIKNRIALSLTRSFPPLRDSIKVLADSTRLVAFIVDVFGFDVLDVVEEFGVPS